MKYLILILGLCFYIQIQAQQKSESQRPPWMRGDLPIQTNHSYWFKQMYGEGKTLSEARQNATLALLGDLMKAKGFTILIYKTQERYIVIHYYLSYWQP